MHKGEAEGSSNVYRNIFLESPEEAAQLTALLADTDDIGVQIKINRDLKLEITNILNAKSLYIYSSLNTHHKVEKGNPMPNLEVLNLDGEN